MYCIKCGAKLSEGQSVCPLCETRVYHPDFEIPENKSTYPKKDFESEAFNKKGLMFVITVLFLIPLILPLILDLSWNSAVTWSGYVIGGVLLLYVSMVLPSWFKHPNPAIFVSSAFVAATLYLLYICLASGGDWFLDFAMPVSLSFGAIMTASSTLLHYLKRGKLYVVGATVMAIGFWCGLLELFLRLGLERVTDFYWSIAPMAVCFIIGMMLIVIEIVKPIKESLRKVFFIG